jgi:hypothetical protein
LQKGPTILAKLAVAVARLDARGGNYTAAVPHLSSRVIEQAQPRKTLTLRTDVMPPAARARSGGPPRFLDPVVGG